MFIELAVQIILSGPGRWSNVFYLFSFLHTYNLAEGDNNNNDNNDNNNNDNNENKKKQS
jgi:hypothetical protein